MDSDDRPPIPVLQVEKTHHTLPEQNLQAMYGQLVQIQQELVRIQQTQHMHTESIDKLERMIAHGRWVRRLGMMIRLVIIFAIIAVVLYFLVDWDALLYMLA